MRSGRPSTPDKVIDRTFGPSGPGAPGIPFGPCRPVGPSSPLSPGIPRSPCAQRNMSSVTHWTHNCVNHISKSLSIRPTYSWSNLTDGTTLSWNPLRGNRKSFISVLKSRIHCRHIMQTITALFQYHLLLLYMASRKALTVDTHIMSSKLTRSPGFPGSPGGPGCPGKPWKHKQHKSEFLKIKFECFLFVLSFLETMALCHPHLETVHSRRSLFSSLPSNTLWIGEKSVFFVCMC